MAIKLETVKQLLDEVDFSEVVEKVEKKIDEAMANPEWVKAWRCGPSNNSNWNFTFGGKIRDKAADEIKDRYLAAGWSDVDIKNFPALEGGEPDSFTVVLYGNP